MSPADVVVAYAEWDLDEVLTQLDSMSARGHVEVQAASWLVDGPVYPHIHNAARRLLGGPIRPFTMGITSNNNHAEKAK